MKTMRIVLASPDSMDGHTIAVHLGEGQITCVVDRTHVDPAILPRAEEAIRRKLGDAVRLPRPLPFPFLPVLLIPEAAPADSSLYPEIEVTPCAIVGRFPLDCASERIVEESRMIGNEIMRWYALPTSRKRFLLAGMQPANDLLTAQAS